MPAAPGQGPDDDAAGPQVWIDAQLLGQRGAPPRVVWVRCGNVTNSELRRVVLQAWPRAASLLAAGEPLVEIRRRQDELT